MDDFGRDLGCLLYGLLWTVVILIAVLTVLGVLILAGVL